MTTLATLRRIVKRHGGQIVSDGCGGLEVMAPPDQERTHRVRRLNLTPRPARLTVGGGRTMPKDR